jgi:tRNA-dihydrouridine synthase B
MSIAVGHLRLRNHILLAPMSGVSDEPFRNLAQRGGAGLVFTEMVASRELAEQRSDMAKRARRGCNMFPFAIQLAGREPHWMAEGARIAQDLGADIIDINMGCPARQVTGGYSGSALMRDLDHALTLIEATVAASKIPVTLKMRLGWDETSLNAPELARRAEAAGVQMVTVHGRTRCQFYGGRADWSAIAAVKREVSIPVIANGDCGNASDARAMLAASGADGVMIGRASYGRPWLAGSIANDLEPGSGTKPPSLAEEAAFVSEHHQGILSLYGTEQGNRNARKHLGWIVDRKREQRLLNLDEARAWRQRLMANNDNRAVAACIQEFFAMLCNAEAQAA